MGTLNINSCVLFQTSVQSSKPATDSLKVCSIRAVDLFFWSNECKELS